MREKTLRCGELKQQLPHISDKMLSGVLRSLEREGFITRKVYPVVPPKAEYTITRRGLTAIPVIETVRKYGVQLMKEFGVEEKGPVGKGAEGKKK